MVEKDKLLQQIDEAIKDKNTSSKNKKLLKEIKTELSTANNKSKYLEIAVKIANIIGSLVKVLAGSG